MIYNHMHQSISEFAAVLHRMRTNNPTAEDIRYLNSKVISPTHRPPAGAFFACSSNRERMAVNSAAVLEHLNKNRCDAEGDWKHRGAIRIVMNVEPTESSVSLDEGRISLIRNMVDTKLANKSGYLDVIIGSPLMVTHNYDVTKCVANGSSGVVLDVRLAPGVEPGWEPLKNGNGIHSVMAKDTVCILLKLDGDHGKVVYYEGLPPGVVVIYPRLTRNHPFIWGNREFKAHLTNYNAVSLIAASTGHKTQGRTLSDGVIMGPPIDPWKYNGTGWIYVVLSRANRGQDVYLMEPLCTDLSKFKERTSINEEMNRLRKLLVEPTRNALRSQRNDDPNRQDQKEGKTRRLSFSQLIGSGSHDAASRQNQKEGKFRRLSFSQLSSGSRECNFRRLGFAQLRGSGSVRSKQFSSTGSVASGDTESVGREVQKERNFRRISFSQLRGSESSDSMSSGFAQFRGVPGRPRASTVDNSRGSVRRLSFVQLTTIAE
jgi:hypothetical protein